MAQSEGGERQGEGKNSAPSGPHTTSASATTASRSYTTPEVGDIELTYQSVDRPTARDEERLKLLAIWAAPTPPGSRPK
jgi:hypothetical protein